MAHVLLVDDHADTQEVIAQLLRTYGHFVECCESAEAALLQVETCRPDAVIADQRLPGMTGVEFISRIRGNARLANLPVILCSADDSRASEARAAGATEFWLKGSEKFFADVARLDQCLADGRT